MFYWYCDIAFKSFDIKTIKYDSVNGNEAA